MPEDCPCEKLWIEDPTVLLKTNLLVEDICESNNLNAFSRSSILGLILATLLSPFLGLGGLGIVLLSLIFLYHRWLFAKVLKPQKTVLKNKKEGFQAGIISSPGATMVTRPTARNPFMNVLIDEIKYNPTKPGAKSVEDPVVKSTMDDYFRVNWFSDPTDVFGKSQNQRQFVTMPSTTIPNDRESLQNWLYKIPGKTCKEGGREACVGGTAGSAIPWLN
jgi:hypothetical protein